LIPLLMAAALQPNFEPERPHLGLVATSFLSGIFAFGAVLIHNLRKSEGFEYVSDANIAVDARIEMLKLRHKVWYDALKLIVTVYLAVAAAVLLYGYGIAHQVIEDPGQAWAVNWFIQYYMLYHTAFLIFGVIAELFHGMKETSGQLMSIRPK